MPGQLNLTGANAAIQLVGNDTITEDQEFAFPDTGGTVVTSDSDGDVEIDGNITADGAITSNDSIAVNGTNNSSAFIVNNGATPTVKIYPNFMQGGVDLDDTPKVSINFTSGNITTTGFVDSVQVYSTANSSAFNFIGQNASNGDAETFTVTGGGDVNATSVTAASVWSESTSGAKNLLNGDGFYQYATDGSTVNAQIINNGNATFGEFNPTSGSTRGFKVDQQDNYTTGLFQCKSGVTTNNAIEVWQANAQRYEIQYSGTASFSNAIVRIDPDNVANYNSSGKYTGDTLDMKKVGLALVALKAAAAASTDYASLKSAIATALADL